jgi:hypothetical protein
MYALTMLSFDSNISKNDQKTVWLIEMHRMLVQSLITLFKRDKAKIDQKKAVALYFENLKRSSEEIKKSILRELHFPRVKVFESSNVSPSHQSISEELRRKFAKNKKDFIVVDEESGLESKVLPMDITIKDGTGKRILAFIEIEGHSRLIARPDGQFFRKRRYQLREELYKFNHPGMPVILISPLDKRRNNERAEELYSKVINL